MKRISNWIALVLLLVCSAGARAGWVDVTEAYLVNPTFSNGNTNGWTIDVSNSVNHGYKSSTYQYDGVTMSDFMEVWVAQSSALSDGVMSQTVALPRGHYRLQADAIATLQGSDPGATGGQAAMGTGVFLFAQEATTPVSTGNNQPRHYAVEFDVATDGNVTLGIRIASTNANWVAADNFCLERETDGDPAPSSSGLVINEVMTCNIGQFVDTSWNYGGWIELYNPTTSAISLSNVYITDTRDNLRKHLLRNAGSVPARGFATIWFDHYSDRYPKQVSFKLDADGGWIALVTATGSILAEQTYPAGLSRTSWARTTDGADTWGVTAEPTPGKTNATSRFATERLAAPTVDVEGHLVSGNSVTVHASWPQGSTLRYTTDGSAPSASDGQTSTTGTFTLTPTTTLRLCAVRDGYLPSEVVTNTYVKKNNNITIPILYISGNANDYFSDQMGMFVKGTNGVSGADGQVENVFQDWERPGTFEYFAPTGERLFCQEVDLSPAGGWSRSATIGYGHTSFKIKANKIYGLNSLNHQFFDEKPYLKHKALQIRNGGNDQSRFKDAALQQIIARSGFYVDYQAYQPVIHYINGRYGYLFNMREPNNKHHGYANYGIDTDCMDQFELAHDSYVQMEGTRDTFDILCNLARQCSDPAVYQRICDTFVDMDEFINYMAACVWMGNNDWLPNTNNVKGYRSNEGDGRFHFVLFDLDQTFDSEFNNLLQRIDAMGEQNEEVATLWKNLLRNADFRKKFVDSFSLVAGSVFEASHCAAVINEMANAVRPMMQLNNDGYRLDETKNALLNDLGSNSSRRNTVLNNMASYSRLSSETRQPINITIGANNQQAPLLYNGMPMPNNKFVGRAFLPVTVEAGEVPGYRFAGWQTNSSTVQSVTVFAKGSAWKYYDTAGSLDGTDWKSESFASNWKSGETPIGYNVGSYSTTTFRTTFQNIQQTTYYISKSFNLTGSPQSDQFYLDYLVDDGMCVYVNGKEVGRYNMPSGTITYESLAPVSNNGDQGTLEIPASLLHEGTNTIAVELHNNTATSSDIIWDAALRRVTSGYLSADPSLVLTTDFGGMQLTAIYQPVTDNDVTPVKINELSAGNSMYVNDYFKKDDWIELYNTTGQTVDVAGMFLTDDPAEPQKFQIPTNSAQQTTIEPHGHLIVWASKRDNKDGQIHANFKLGNADGEQVMLTSEDGAWSDQLPYMAHGGKETVGLYPDGSTEVFRIAHPSIGKVNRRSMYDEFLFTNVPQQIEPTNFHWNLNEGWNWVSHPMEQDVAISEISAHAQRFVGQTEELVRVDGAAWAGNLSALTAGKAYKVLMDCDAEYTFSGPFYDAARGLRLHTGWNWIGYPLTSGQLVDEALARFTPSEGDVLVGRQGFTTFENGQWLGSLETLKEGTGYLYKSAAPKTLFFAEPSDEERRVRPPFRLQPRTPWTVMDGAYADVMGLVAQLSEADIDTDQASLSVGAFSSDGECRGIGKYIDGQLFITVYGTVGEPIVFKASDAVAGLEYDVAESFTFESNVLGSRANPVTLHIGGATDVTAPVGNAAVLSVAYYSINGAYAGSSERSLKQGIYIKKCIMNDGTTITKKIIR
ncbi:MAG: CotH kinase family protein [Bacteroidaceae bacterium]|nr:CotH kinase family protein [Bacteroidaceae bacterium]